MDVPITHELERFIIGLGLFFPHWVIHAVEVGLKR
jgi:hypothetical protein